MRSRVALLCMVMVACDGDLDRTGSRDAGRADGGAADAGAPPADAGRDAGPDVADAGPVADAGRACPGDGPAYLHGDLWAFWFNYRVACSPQHRWLWICEQRHGAGGCPEEQRRFDDCWNARGDFPPTSWGDDSTPTPHSANYGVCQPHHWADKNGEDRRPGNPVPCDVRTHDYDRLRTLDPRFGVDWWAGGTSMRHLTLKVFEAGADPMASAGQADGLIALSTHPGDRSAFMDGLANHGAGGGPAGCVPALSGDGEDPYPAQSFGAFFWVEVPTDRPVTLAASWIGPVSGDDIPTGCVAAPYTFPASFAYHAVDGKPWLITNPCWDVQASVSFEPGRHYVWDVHGLRALDGCDGPPEALLEVVPEPERAPFRSGECR